MNKLWFYINQAFLLFQIDQLQHYSDEHMNASIILVQLYNIIILLFRNGTFCIMSTFTFSTLMPGLLQVTEYFYSVVLLLLLQ